MGDFGAAHLQSRAVNFVLLTPLELLDRTLVEQPERPAVAWRDRSWNHAEFGGAMVARLTTTLPAQVIGRWNGVSVCLGNRPERLTAHFAVPACRAVLNSIDTRLSGQDLACFLIHSAARLRLCNAHIRPEGTDVPVLQIFSAPGAGDGPDLFDSPARPWDPVCSEDATQANGLNYTIGTTGWPMGVVITLRGACLNALGNLVAPGTKHRQAPSPDTADITLRRVVSLLGSNDSGGAARLPRQGGTRADPRSHCTVVSDQNFLRARGRLHADGLNTRKHVPAWSCRHRRTRTLSCSARRSGDTRRLTVTSLPADGLQRTQHPIRLQRPKTPTLQDRAQDLARQARRQLTSGTVRVMAEIGVLVCPDVTGEIVLVGFKRPKAPTGEIRRFELRDRTRQEAQA